MRLARKLSREVLQAEFSLLYSEFSSARLLYDYFVFLEEQEISIEKHAHIICQHLEHDPLLFSLIYRFRSIDLWNDEVIVELLKVAAHAKFIYDFLSALSDNQDKDKENIPKVFSCLRELIAIQEILQSVHLTAVDYAIPLIANLSKPEILLCLLQMMAPYPDLITSERLDKLIGQDNNRLLHITTEMQKRQQDAGGFMYPGSWAVYVDGLVSWQDLRLRTEKSSSSETIIEMPVTPPRLIEQDELSRNNHRWTPSLFSPPGMMFSLEEVKEKNEPCLRYSLQ